MLENFKGGWLYYLSVLETEIIEAKLMVILDSLTFKYSRQPQLLVVQPDRITSSNLRISEKIKILNQDSATNKQTKFFKPLSEDLIDPNRELDVRNHVDSVLQTLNHQVLKQDLDKKLREEGTSIQEILDKQADEATNKKYSVHKDCAVAGIEAICRRPKHHMIASVLWLIDFTLRKVQRKAEFFVGDRNRKSEPVRAAIEQEYEDVLDVLKKAIETNYGDKGDEINEALDVVDFKEGGYETEFERHMRLKNQAEEDKLRKMNQQIEEEKRRRRTTMSVEQLIHEEVHQAAHEVKKQQRQELEKFLDMRAGLDKNGTEFMQMLERSKMHFGPYALQLAEEYFEQQMKRFREKKNPALRSEQEKISFVKMEYFLYGVAEADRLIEQLKCMERRINTLAQEADNRDDDARALKDEYEHYQYMSRQGVQDRAAQSRLSQVRRRYEAALEKARASDSALSEQRFEITSKETELLLVFRELMSCDFYVPDHYFDREQLMRKKEKKQALEQFVVPLKTFWREIELEEYYETDLTDKRYFKKVNPMPDIQSKIGQFLSKPLRDSLLRDQAKLQRLQEGGSETALRAHEPEVRNDRLVFEKFMSHGQQRQDEALAHEKEVIDYKTSRKAFEADVPFDFHRQQR